MVELQRRTADAVLDALDAVVLILDARWRVLRANPAARRVMGRGQEDLAGCCFWELFAEADQAAVLRKVVEDAALGGTPPSSDAPPVSDAYVVALGHPPKLTFLIARVAHVTRSPHEGESRFLVGCSYVDRADY